MSDNTKYAYAVARVRAVETKLLDKGRIDRMVDAKSFEDSIKILGEAEYGDSAGDIENPLEYEKLLMQEERKLYGFLKSIAPEPRIIDLFQIKNDFHNIKVVLKSEFLDKDYEAILLETGSISVNKLRLMVKDRNMIDMPPLMRKAVEECIDTFSRSGDPQVIDLILDKASFRQMKEMVGNFNNSFLQGMVEAMIDIANIKTFLRVKKLNKSWDFLQKVLLTGGRIDSKLFIEKLNDSLENFIESMRYTPYGGVCEEGIVDYQTTGKLTRFEKLSDNYIVNYAKKAKYISLGVEPLIGYLIAKETEMRNVRIIMVGKINNISNEIIRERLRETYV